MRLLQWLTLSCFITPCVFAQEHETQAESYLIHGPHHLSVLLADTHIDGEGNNFTVDIDYEYRVNQLLGLGGVVEKANGELDAVTTLAVADIHLNNGLIFQLGPGYERRHHENVLVSRIGGLYEFEIENFTISPQLHWDYHEHGPNAVVAGIALGFAF